MNNHDTGSRCVRALWRSLLLGGATISLMMLLDAASAAAAKIEFFPSPILFTAETESKNGGFYLEGPGEVLVKEIKIVAGKDMKHFEVKAECGGAALPVTLKEAGMGKKACLFGVSDKCANMGKKTEVEAEYEFPPGSGVKKETVEMQQPNP